MLRECLEESVVSCLMDTDPRLQPLLISNGVQFSLSSPPTNLNSCGAMGDAHTVKRPNEISDPIVQEVHELRKPRGLVVVLPDVALQQSRVVRQAVKDFCRRERESSKLAHGRSLRHSGDPAWSVCL